ncbi:MULTISPECIES: DUF2478 domain-containing protein [unclassified Bradyrhizobium]|uniref:DUF2478 domain-containing protein n=1 Tax=unclassified Bradyrhizobium TaxID=2631580 RepID=UPI0028ECA5A7|nr:MULTISPECIES: DUF2478 domain-containing protein [unclassified Bradyrhizobium]
MGIAEIATCQIVALQGAASAVIQGMLHDFAARLSATGLRVVGVVESAADHDHPCKSMVLRSLDDDRVFSISQDLGPGSQACSLAPEGLALACAAVQEQIARGTDIVILSKFGKQEAMGRGLSDAFGTAIAAGVPIITSVSPALMSEWRNFAGEFGQCVQAEIAQRPGWLEGWSGRVVTASYARDMIRPVNDWIGTG